MQLVNKTISFLKQNPEQRFTGRDIAEWIWKTYPDDCQKKIDRSSVNDEHGLIQQLVAEIGRDRNNILAKNDKIRTTEERPRKFYFTKKTSEEEASSISLRINDGIDVTDSTQIELHTKKTVEEKISEHDLYPLLSEYLAAEFSVHSKRINEGKSSNKKGNKGNHWLHPDLVGLEDLSNTWVPIIKKCAKEAGDKKARLWSFEVKRFINRSNVREYFFQTVSNSSWANFGYLVASEIASNAMQELQMLSSLHGIGLIRLDPELPTESTHLIPAREKSEIDWSSANRLAEENDDFEDFVDVVTDFHKTGKIHL